MGSLVRLWPAGSRHLGRGGGGGVAERQTFPPLLGREGEVMLLGGGVPGDLVGASQEKVNPGASSLLPSCSFMLLFLSQFVLSGAFSVAGERRGHDWVSRGALWGRGENLLKQGERRPW